MIPVLTAAQMREADRRTIEEIGLPGAVLMENAGAAVAAELRRRYGTARVVVLAGRGNNGGDGFVIARRLGPQARVLLLTAAERIEGDARLHLDALRRSGGSIQEVPDARAWEAVRGEASGCVRVDAMLGTGLSRAPEGLIGRVVEELSGDDDARGPVVAVDIPTGVMSDSGALDWPAVRADLTVTFAAPKRGHVLPPACDRVGELVIADIGIPASLLRSDLSLIEGKDALAAFPPRRPDAHKGRFGHLLVVAGGVGKTGAAVLSAHGALRAGAGLVTVATPGSALRAVAVGRVEAMTEPLSEEGDGGLGSAALERAVELAAARDAVVVGPGLGQAASTAEFVRSLAAACAKPLLLDADGLNAIAAGGAAAVEALQRRRAPTVLTPHPGEAGRLLGRSAGDVQRERLEAAGELARRAGAWVVLKGQRTLVAAPDGRCGVCGTGNAGMATGGTGDVLSGVIGALLAAAVDPDVACRAGVHLHGAAGDRVASRIAPEGLLAGDLAEALPEALLALREASRG